MSENNHKNIFIIESPLQLINAVEAKFHFKTSNNILIIIKSNNAQNNNQINSILNTGYWDSIIKIEFKDYYLKGYFGVIKRGRDLYKIVEKFKNINKLFIGFYGLDFIKYICNKLNFKRLILLDDGTQTIDIMRDIKHSKITLSSLFKKFFLVFNTNTLKDLSFFTSYENDYFNEYIIKNDYKFLKTKIQNRNIDINKLFFLGSNMVDSGFLSLKTYIENLNSIILDNPGKQFYYIPHRRESDNNINFVVRNTEMELLETNESIETYLVYKSNELPGIIVSFICSALINLKHIFNERILVKGYGINDSLILDEQFKTRFKYIKSYLRDHIDFIDHY
jgi:hypothetical protein